MRVVYLEIAGKICADLLILSLMMFISRREKLHKLRSDNSKNFVDASKELE